MNSESASNRSRMNLTLLGEDRGQAPLIPFSRKGSPRCLFFLLFFLAAPTVAATPLHKNGLHCFDGLLCDGVCSHQSKGLFPSNLLQIHIDVTIQI